MARLPTPLNGAIGGIFLSVVLTGCTVGPNYLTPTRTVSEAWITPMDEGDLEVRWWAQFDDPLLTELVETAIADNKDLAEAGERLSEARANRDAITGTATPQISGSAAATQSRLSENGQLPVGRVPGLGRDLSIFDAGFDASWEIDLWGGRRRAIEGAGARVQSSEEGRRTVILQVIAEVVRSYVDLRAAQSLRANASEDVVAQDKILRLISDRHRAGLASRSDVARAETQARGTAALVPQFDGDAAAAVFRLGLLLGKPPEALYDRLSRPGPLPKPETAVRTGLRSDILRRRPDIRQAERDLAAATADIGVATANLFPRFSLLGGVGLQAQSTEELLSSDSVRFSVGPSLRWPIFSGGRIRAQIRAADAREAAALVRYERAILSALSDSETAINRLSATRSSSLERKAALAAASEGVGLARRRYEAGEDDLTALLQTQLAFSAADRASIQAEAAALQNLASLFKALGGGWEVADDAVRP